MGYRKNPLNAEELRRLARERLRKRGGAAMTPPLESDVDQLIEELEIHQIELELQNEHLDALRSQLESALAQSSELYDFAPVGILTLDRTGRILKLNLAAATLLGSERTRLLGSRFDQFLAAQEVSVCKAQLEQPLCLGDMQDKEITLARPGQPVMHIHLRIASSSQAQTCQVILIDITERKLLEERLRESAQRWELALEVAGDGVWDWNVRTGEMVFSRRFAQMLGFAEHEYGKQLDDWTARIHPDDKPQVIAALQDHLAGKTPSFLNEHRAQCLDGSWKWILSQGGVVRRGEAGQALRMIGRHVDILARKNMEEALAASTRFQQAVFDSLSAHIAVLDRHGRIVQTNAAWRKYGPGYRYADASGFMGVSYLEVLDRLTGPDPDLQQAVAAGMASVIAGGIAAFQLPRPFLSAADQRWFSLQVRPVGDAEGRLVVSHEDVSRLKATELENYRLLSTDALTGALSRSNFLNLAGQELARSMRYRFPLMVLMLDLDHFRLINERHGHAAGDAVLQGFVRNLREVLRTPDLLGRMDGEDFALLLPNTTLAGGQALAERIVGIGRTCPVEVGGARIAYTVSIGGACWSAERSVPALLQRAEAALSRAKLAGRDRLELEPA
jgi:diguanylate cyclase (GGDEF)-like protein/PAS domain S-box-containing protein